VNDPLKEQALLRVQLAEELDSYQHDPLGFVENMFQWGQGELKGCQPEQWQSEYLDDLGKQLRSGQGDNLKYVGDAIQKAVASGNGIGKSALVSWLILWSLSTMEDAMGVVTANTQNQLKSKTWAQLGKWYRFFLAKHLFVYTATAIHSADPAHEQTWRFDAIPWSKSNPESFAGLHNQGKRVILIFDEASAIPDIIWETGDGCMTDSDTELLWFAFGNPTRNIGRFHACFHKQAHRWQHQQIDSRKVTLTNKTKIEAWVKDYGEDSDYVRIHVRGVFPRTGDRQFIGSELVEEARQRVLGFHSQDHAPKILGVDSAWTGEDEIVCTMRQGLACKVLWVQAKNDDDVALARRLAQTEDEEKADAVFIDFAYGTGLYSVGKAWNRTWTLVQFGGEAIKKDRYFNKRAEMYGLTRQWLKDGGALPDDPRLHEELCAAEEVFREDGKIQLEKKEDIKERLGFSPGRADSLVLTFAANVKKKAEYPQPEARVKGRAEFARPHEYDPMSGV
jgi:hypothetical protein